ncbi:hypothetical protein CDL15_Pgr010141 [Punica granatum]|uniref:Uncharacterized protein n=1 Tax=Punica granatum TaxID=22663 RepID=A0A218Y2Q0_PUNGR|nr:hypothetical protein CDL15_Pgr010141 [Punica granatum]
MFEWKQRRDIDSTNDTKEENTGIGPTRGGRRLPGLVWSKEALGYVPSRNAVSFHGSRESGEFLRPRFGSFPVVPSCYMQLNGKEMWESTLFGKRENPLAPDEPWELTGLSLETKP